MLKKIKNWLKSIFRKTKIKDMAIIRKKDYKELECLKDNEDIKQASSILSRILWPKQNAKIKGFKKVTTDNIGIKELVNDPSFKKLLEIERIKNQISEGKSNGDNS